MKNCTVIRDSAAPPRSENILIEGNKIAGFTEKDSFPGFTAKDLGGKVVIPGFVQTHVHLCQVMFRGLADDLSLLDWLKKKIWPLEASHDDESTYLSALLGGLELLSGGVTSVCVMESVRHAEQTARAIEELGIRAVFGKAMMDYTDTPEELGGMPDEFIETTRETIDSSLALLKKWHGAADGRISYAFMPRGILTTSEDLVLELKKLSSEYDVLVHTHACETIPESRLVEQRRGLTEIKYLEKLGLASPGVLLAHCVCVDDEDIGILARHGMKVAHCPLANLKLASGVAPISRLRESGIVVSLGSDGAPCNNNLDMFQEMKFAALLQKGIYHEPTLMPAKEIFDIATMGGAKALHMESLCGTLETGKNADLAILDMEQTESAPSPASIATLVYSGNRHMVTDTMVDGRWVYRNKKNIVVDEEKIRFQAKQAIKKLLDRFERRK